MKRNTLTKYMAGIAAAAMLCACSDFTEIDQKGLNTLSRVSDLDKLLNAEYAIRTTDVQEVCGDLIYAYSPLSTVLKPAVKTRASIIMGWDEEGHDAVLPGLTSSDAHYADCYEYIGRIANPIISLADAADGDQTKKMAVKAEAYVVRAYFHLLAAQKFAPAYDKATAANTLALAYVKEDQDIKQPTVPVSLAEFYSNVVSDCDAALAIPEFPDFGVNNMRFGRAAAYAVKAHALMCMQEPQEAAKAAAEALKIRNTITDYFTMLAPQMSMDGSSYQAIVRPKVDVAEDYFSDYSIEFYDTYPAFGDIEDGHCVKENFNTLNKMYGMLGDASMMVIGEPGFIMTYDLKSSWGTIALRTTQMILIQAEAAIEAGNIDDAMGYLDQIRAIRIAPDVYKPLQGAVTSKADAISHLKQTGLGENIFTIWSFSDQKRWTRLADYRETKTRTLSGLTMTLTPDSKMWVFPIPQNVINNNPNFRPYLNN